MREGLPDNGSIRIGLRDDKNLMSKQSLEVGQGIISLEMVQNM